MENKIKSLQKIVENEFPELINLLERHMNFDRWGFKQTFYGLSQDFPPSIIYDSKSCRVRFIWLPADVRDGPDSSALDVRYGRLHASNQQRFMVWNGHNCHSWHSSNIIINFLDGLSPMEAVKKKFKIPPIKDQFIQRNKEYVGSNVEWGVRECAFIWEHYGKRLFDLFDLRSPELWEQYALFIKEFYKLDPGVFNPNSPPPENIC
jgi:hypothetical protein